MKDLRDRCESLCLDLGGPTSMCPSVHGPYVDKLEAFAREIRDEALDEAAELAKDWECGCWRDIISPSGHIRALKTDALAAKEDEK